MLRTYDYFVFLSILMLALGSYAKADPVLTLDGFIQEVRTRNHAYQGAVETREGSVGRAREADLLTSPSLFSTAQLISDAKLPVLPSFSFDRVNTDNFTLGVSEQFDFGLKARLYYAYDYTSYVNATIPGVTSLDPAYFSPRDARPVLELSLPVWGGGFGRTIRAQKDATVAQSRADQFTAESQVREILVQAETSYWALAINRELVTIQERALNEAQATYNYNNQKVKRNLAESSDLLQSEAALESARLSLKAARDNEQHAVRQFNTVRNAPVDAVPEALAPIDWESFEKNLVPGVMPGDRADVEAAAAQSQAAQATARVAVENDRPTLEIYGSYAMNGRSYQSFSDTLSNSFDSGRPTSIVGVRFNMPLNFAAQNEARHGAERQSLGADLRYQQTLADQSQQWFDLINRLHDAQDQYHYARVIENVQKKKLENEKLQLRRGRSTTFQVLQFEQDYTNSQLVRARAGAQALDLRSQLKRYQSSSISK
ncbi:MAG: TolC family protein [Bdellovibrionia bacterium]